MSKFEILPPERRIVKVSCASAPVAGFAGPGHTAITVVSSAAPMETDPFVMLMDDTLDFRPGQSAGEASPRRS